MVPFYKWDSIVSRLQNHYVEIVYFLQTGSQEFLLHLVEFWSMKRYDGLPKTFVKEGQEKSLAYILSSDQHKITKTYYFWHFKGHI